MTFLELCRALRRECGVAGTGPTTVAAQTGELDRLVNWVAQSWQEIGLLHENWRFLRQDLEKVLTPSDGEYSLTDLAITSFRKWKPDSFRYYTTSIGYASEQEITWLDYDAFKRYWLFGSRRTEDGVPLNVSAKPDDSLLIGPRPGATGYTIVGEYFRLPNTLVDDADIPLLPEEYHYMIVYLAMMKYGTFEAAPEVYQRGEIEYKKMLFRLELTQLDALTIGDPLA